MEKDMLKGDLDEIYQRMDKIRAMAATSGLHCLEKFFQEMEEEIGAWYAFLED